jgi:ABC-type sugar transport system, permease component
MNLSIKNSTNKKPLKLSKIIIFTILSIASIAQLFPLVWLVDFSLCKSGDLFGAEILKWPSDPQFINYKTAWIDGKIPQYLFNSIFINFATIVFTVLFALMMSYALVRMRWRIRKGVMTFILLGLMIPIHATLLPNFITFKAVGLQDSYLSLIVPYVAFGLPLAVFILSGFLESIPRAIEEAAIIDGCGIFRIIFSIILPITKPSIATVVIMTFLNTWNEFIMAATYLSSDQYKTLPFAVYNFAGQYASNYAVQFAVMALVALPSLIIYILMNEQITKGAMAGSVK